VDERHLTAEDLAERLGVDVQSIYWLNATGEAPPRLKIGKRVRYRLADVLAWEESRLVGQKPA